MSFFSGNFTLWFLFKPQVTKSLIFLLFMKPGKYICVSMIHVMSSSATISKQYRSPLNLNSMRSLCSISKKSTHFKRGQSTLPFLSNVYSDFCVLVIPRMFQSRNDIRHFSFYHKQIKGIPSRVTSIQKVTIKHSDIKWDVINVVHGAWVGYLKTARWSGWKHEWPGCGII